MKNAPFGAALAASIAMSLAACGGTSPKPISAADAADPTPIECKETNSCKGHGSCAGVAQGEKHSCNGHNECAGNVRTVTKKECAAIGGDVLVASN